MPETAARLAGVLLAIAALAPNAGAQTQVVDASQPVAITSTAPVVIDTVSVESAGTRDVGLAAHFYVEGSGFDGSGYEFRLERVTPSAAVVGTANWAPAAALNASAAGDTVSITGFDESVATPALYRLVGQKVSASAANLSVTARGIDAFDRISGTVIAGVRAAASVAVNASTLAPIQTLTVEVPFASDILLWGHVTLTTSGTTEGYGVGICDEAGDTVFANVWFPAAGTAETNVVPVAAVAVGVAAGSTTFSICATRVGTAPTATATFRSLQAMRSIGTIFGGGGLAEVPPLTSTSYTTIWILDAASTHPDGMAVLVQTAPVAAGFQNDLYEFGIHRGSCAGARIGAAGWRPGLSPTTESATDNLLVTGFDPSPGEPQSYAFCARKASAAAPDLSFYGLTMAAAPLPAPEPAGAATALASGAALYAIARSRRTAAVSAPSGRARPR